MTGYDTTSHRRMLPLKRPDPAWFVDCVVGSVIQEGAHGPMRIVRKVSRYHTGRLYCVSVTIRRRSWTGRAYTVLTAADLKTRGFRLIPNVRIKFKRLIDVRIYQAINQGAGQPYIIGADEVVGIP